LVENRRLGAAIGVLILAALFLSLAVPAVAAPLSARPQIALTFDDAPQASSALLFILEHKNAKATFFVVGIDAENNPVQALALASAGMLIANHSYDHSDFATATAEQIRANVMQAQAAIYAQTGVTPRWYRSPYNTWNPAYTQVLPELGLKLSWATINPKDWAGPPPQTIIDSVLASAAPGGNIQLHDMTDKTCTIEALPGLIDGLRAAGYDLVTLDDLWLSAIEGTVTARSGEALGGVLVTAYDTTGSAVATASTGADGSYRIARMAPGSYRLGFSRADYHVSYYGGATNLGDAEPIAAARDYTIEGAAATLKLIDLVAPVTSLAPTLPTGWVDRDVTFGLSAFDSESPTATVTYVRLDPSGVTSECTGPVTVEREGVTDIGYWSVDEAGNVEATNTATVMIDKTAPETVSDAAAAYVSSATVSLAATDVLSGVAGTTFQLDGGVETSGTHVFVDAAGRHSLRFWSTDAVGNVEPSDTVEFAVVYPTFVGLSADRSSFRLGEQVGLTAELRHSSLAGPRMDGRTVQLERSANGVDGWSVVATASTSPTGSCVFSAMPGTTTHYRVVYPGESDTYARGASAPTVVEFLAPGSTRLSVRASAAEPAYRSRTGITGILNGSPASGSTIQGQRVLLQTRTSDGWLDSGAATTTASGAVAFSVRPTAKSAYRLSYAGLPGVYLPIASSAVTVTPKPSLSAPAAPRRMRTTTPVRVYGALKPRHSAGSKPVRIYLYRKTGHGWRRSGAPVSARVSDFGTYSHYAARIRLAKKGSWRLRAWAPADSGHAGTWSSGYDYVTVK
jgi:peptidoglycan-N-acetylglucosamine deacetylase